MWAGEFQRNGRKLARTLFGVNEHYCAADRQIIQLVGSRLKPGMTLGAGEHLAAMAKDYTTILKPLLRHFRMIAWLRPVGKGSQDRLGQVGR